MIGGLLWASQTLLPSALQPSQNPPIELKRYAIIAFLSEPRMAPTHVPGAPVPIVSTARNWVSVSVASADRQRRALDLVAPRRH